MFRTGAIFIICIVYFNCASAYTTKRGKCSIQDDDCQKNLYGGVILDAAESGIPDIGIPVLDPYLIKNTEITLMNLIKLKNPETTIKGIKSCRTTKYHTDMEKKVTTITYTCKMFSLEGTYHIETTPIIDALIGNIKIHGDGFGTVKIGNVEIDLDIPFVIKKLGDGELHFVIESDKITFSHNILGSASMTADNIYVGSQDVTTVTINIINENWRFFVKSFAEQVIGLGVKIFTENVNKFFRATPIKDLIIEDLSAYATQ